MKSVYWTLLHDGEEGHRDGIQAERGHGAKRCLAATLDAVGEFEISQCQWADVFSRLIAIRSHVAAGQTISALVCHDGSAERKKVWTREPKKGNSLVVEESRDRESTDAAAMEASFIDPDAFGVIVERHFRAIYGYLARRVGPDAEDLAADTFAIAFRGRHNFDLARTDARPWLYGIATNLLRRHRRSEFRQIAAYTRAAAELSIVEDHTESVVARIEHTAAVARVAAAFGKLDGEHRDALYLIAVVELSYSDAAEALGLPVGTLHSRVARARSRLRDLAGHRGQKPDITSVQDRE